MPKVPIHLWDRDAMAQKTAKQQNIAELTELTYGNGNAIWDSLGHVSVGTSEGRLYWVVNSVAEIVKVKDLQSLCRVNFPLTLRMQDQSQRYVQV